MELSGKYAVITGGASGLGEATVRRFVESGASVAVLDRDEVRARALCEALPGDRVIFEPVDLTSASAVERAVDAVAARFGAIHVCATFAGIAVGKRVLTGDEPHPLALFEQVLAVNLVGTFDVIRHCVKHMAAGDPVNADGERGVVLTTASVAALEGQSGQAAYSASKGGVLAMTLPLARDLARFGIRVNCIVPGLIHTPLADGMTDALYATLTEAIEFPSRMGRPEEIAAVAVHAVENAYLNGATLRVDGALRLPAR